MRTSAAVRTRFALAIVDLTLADGDGVELELRGCLGASAPPFAIFSGHERPDPLPDGVVAVFAKPIGMVELMTGVKIAIAEARWKSGR